MLFQSFGFFLLFSIAFAIYWSVRKHSQKMAWLLLASAIFYAIWNPWLILLVAFTAGTDYLFALRIEASADPRTRRAWLTASLVFSISLLSFFKYAHFFLGAVCDFAGVFGLHLKPPEWNLPLPLGISFYTFETISYVVDVYRGRLRAERNVLRYALYIMFFPHLIAGPIVRPGQFLPQITRAKRFDWMRFQWGAQLFLRGLLKKTAVADRLALLVVDPIFQAPGLYSAGMLWLGAVAYAAQAYCDFSGYTDMAIGAAHAFGFKLPQNFNRPFFADSVGDFWRRWHITLSTWLRDYLYIPTGGSRGGNWRTSRNLILTMAVAGLWHGAGWNYLVFGLLHGTAMSLERQLPHLKWARNVFPRAARIAATFTFFVLTLVIFRTTSFGLATTMLDRMFQHAGGQILSHNTQIMALFLIGAVFAGQAAGGRRVWKRVADRIPAPAIGVAMACLFLIIQLCFAENDTPFIYFQF